MRDRLWMAVPLLLLGACAGDPADAPDSGTLTADTGATWDVPCAVRGEPELEVAHALDPWGLDEAAIGCGIPPQGGAPYARFRLRIANLDLSDGGTVAVTLTDRDSGEALGAAELTMGFVCANVGDDADHWLGSEVHARFDGYQVDELIGRRVEVTASVEGDGQQVVATGTGTLSPM